MIRVCSSSNRNRLINVYKSLPNFFSHQISSIVPTNDHTDKKDNDDNITLLYQRNPERNVLPRASFLVSSLNSIYWMWYVVDFVPAVNASPIDSFHIDPIYGYGGLGLSILIQSAFTLYPLSLVSKIAHRASGSSFTSNSDSGHTKSNRILQSLLQKHEELLVWKHTLPLLQTSSKPLVFPVGRIAMDKTSESTRIILEDLEGNIERFEGYFGLKKNSAKVVKNVDCSSSLTRNFPILVEIRDPSEVYDAELILHTLLSGRAKHNHSKGVESRRSNEASDAKVRHKFHQQRPKNQKQKRHRGKR